VQAPAHTAGSIYSAARTLTYCLLDLVHLLIPINPRVEGWNLAESVLTSYPSLTSSPDQALAVVMRVRLRSSTQARAAGHSGPERVVNGTGQHRRARRSETRGHLTPATLPKDLFLAILDAFRPNVWAKTISYMLAVMLYVLSAFVSAPAPRLLFGFPQSRQSIVASTECCGPENLICCV
jgi:hypothetical protein